MWSAPRPGPEQIAKDKGALLMEEPTEITARRARGMRKGAGILAALGGALLVVGIGLGSWTQWRGFSTSLILALLLFGPLVLGLAVVIFRASARLRPIRYYENGLEAYPLVGDRIIFVSYGEVVSIQETRIPLEGEVFQLRTTTPGLMPGLPRDMPGVGTIVDHIRSRMGRPEFVLRPPAAASPATRRFATLSPIIALVIAAVASLFFAMTSAGGLFGSGAVVTFGLVFSPFGMIAVTYATVRLRSMERFVGPAPSVKVPAFIVVCLLVYGAANLGLASVLAQGGPPPPEIGLRPPLSALLPGTYENQTLNTTGVIRIDAGEMFVFRNTSMNLAPGNETTGGIWVGMGGQLTLDNVTIRAAGARITFEILGRARILRSDIADLAGDPAKDHTDGGLEIYSSDVILDGTTVHDTATNGIFVVGASPTIVNSTVLRPGDDGIELQHSEARIENSTVASCGWAMIIWSASPVIRGNHFVDNAHGLDFTESGGRVENNTFERNQVYAIRLVDSSNPSIEGNTFLTTADDVEHVSTLASYVTLVCGPGTAIIGAVCLGVLYWRHRRDRAAIGAPPGT